MEVSGETVVFFREGGSYRMQLSGLKPTADEVSDHVAVNPGVVRAESLTGDVLWPPKAILP